MTGSESWIPGTYIAYFTLSAEGGLEGRLRGLELRDTILVLRPGPSVGFVFLFRVPLSGTVLDQVAKTGTGVLNVDACRVSSDLSEFFSKTTGKPRSGMGHAHGYGMGEGYGGDRANPPNELGRWPPNGVLMHAAGCRRNGVKKVRGANPIGPHPGITFPREGFGFSGAGSGQDYVDEDGMEEVASWICVSGCPVPLLDGQSGMTRDTAHSRGERTGNVYGGGKGPSGPNTQRGYSDVGGASRFFPQFENDLALRSWVEVLIGARPV